MNVYYDINNLPKWENAVVTIGTFDGVHCGHQAIIETLKKEAKKINGTTVIITFSQHPRSIVQQSSPITLLSTEEEKIQLLEKNGIDHLVVIPFDEKFAQQTAEEYIHHFLYEKITPTCIIIGYDHKFGKDRTGNYSLLEKYGKTLGFCVKEIDKQLIESTIVSSTKIREAISQSNIAFANTLLGYAFSFQGTVVKGNQLGRTLGYPTANIEVANKQKLIPSNGIYVVTASILEDNTKQQWKGMMSIGIRPTINGKDRVIEVNIFDFDRDIYGKTVRVSVLEYMRAEVKFESLDALVSQLHKDKVNTLTYFEQRTFGT